jgi:uncharacterized membrane protein (DUF485 family)
MRSWRRGVAVLAGLVVLVAAEVFLRRTLEHADQHLYSFFEYFYPAAEETLFHGNVPLWKLFLPLAEVTGAWSSSIVITHLVEMRIGVANTWYLFNAVLVIVSFATAWLAFESVAFSFTFAICMGFGTHFYHSYLVTGGMGSPLIAMAFEVLLLCAYRFIIAPRQQARWWALASGVIAIWTTMTYEGWLDLVAFACVAGPVAAAIMSRRWPTAARRTLGVTAALFVLACVYVYVKIRLGYGQTSGSESDVVFNYHLWAPAVEDVVSNVITHFYMAATNFLPPVFLSSTALFELGADRLVAFQRGYHEAYAYLVPMHYLFLWRYAAGAAMLAAIYLLLKLVRNAWREPTPDRIALLVFLIMILMAGSTHALVKIRPMKTTVSMGYHVLVGVMGSAMLISYGVMKAWREWRGLAPRVAVTMGVWGVIFYGALARPIMLNHLTSQTGVPGIYPNPMATLREMLGLRSDPTGDLNGFRLVKFGSPAPAASPAPPPPPETFSGFAGKLSTLAPLLNAWDPLPGVTVTKEYGGYVVDGSTAGGYQLLSPPIAVPARHQVIFKVEGQIERGMACLGALTADQQKWLFPASAPLSEFLVDTGSNDSIRLVFDACRSGQERPRFHVQSISYAVIMPAQ